MRMFPRIFAAFLLLVVLRPGTLASSSSWEDVVLSSDASSEAAGWSEIVKRLEQSLDSDSKEVMSGQEDRRRIATPSTRRAASTARRRQQQQTGESTAATSKKDAAKSARKPQHKQQSTSTISPVASTSTTAPSLLNELRQTYPTLLTVPTDFLLDPFNLAHLGPVLERQAQSMLQESGIEALSDTSYYRQALELWTNGTSTADPILLHTAQQLYLQVHQRYVCSPQGLAAVHKMLRKDPLHFGPCPRLNCRAAGLLPQGHDTRRTQRYCPHCQQVYVDWLQKVSDATAWGPSFCNLYRLVYGATAVATASPTDAPRIFGFRVHPKVLQ